MPLADPPAPEICGINSKKEVSMAEAKEKIVLVATYAGEDPERATFPFMLATAAPS